MYNHAPANYKYGFCFVGRGEAREGITPQSDVFYRDDDLTAFVNMLHWPNNPVRVDIISNKHHENIYSISDEVLGKIHVFSKRLAVALKEITKCEGISVRQHNEPAGDQDVWHYHVQLVPRWEGDRLYQLHDEKMIAKEKDRAEYASKLRKYFDSEFNT